MRCGGLMLVIGSTVVQGQAPPPSAAEADAHVAVRRVKLGARQSIYSAHYPIDSLNDVMAATATRWLSVVRSSPVTGMQRDPAARVSTVARDDSYAKGEIDARLAEPTLSFADRTHI
jgi:hypothetical protein